MNADDDALQEQEWQALYELVVKTMAKWGVDEPFGNGDYLIVDDNYSWRRQQVEVHNLKMLKVEIVKALQGLLKGFPNWEIVMTVDIPGKEYWPRMGFTVRHHEIIDGLQRKVLPEEFRFLKIPGSRPGTGYD